MKKILILVTSILLTLSFTACENSDTNDEKNNSITLTIKNESAIEIVDVLWNNTPFTIGVQSIKPGTSVTKEVQNGSGYLYFKKKNSSISVRTDQLIIVNEKENTEVIITNNTIIMKINDASSKNTLLIFYQVNGYTVSFDSNGGDGMIPAVQVENGSGITLPNGNGLSKIGYELYRWNTNADGTGTDYNIGFEFTPTEDIILYAKWVQTTVPGTNLAGKLAWLESNALSGINYTIEINANESISPHTLSYNGQDNIQITLTGFSSMRTISLSANGSMFTIESGVTLILGNRITLQGRSDNTASLVTVNYGGGLIINTGTVISGNTRANGSGGGIYAAGNLTMNGGDIHNHTIINGGEGGGVFVSSTGTFIMNEGTISNNKVGSTASPGCGGGVRVEGNFTMTGGFITGNTVQTLRGNGYGAGVDIYRGNFNKTGGTINGPGANGNNVLDRNGNAISGSGHAVAAFSVNDVVKNRDTTAGPTDNLSFNGTTGSFTGSWE